MTDIDCFLAIEPCLQLGNAFAGQDQRFVLQDVIDVGTSSRHHIDTGQVGRGVGEAEFDGIAINHQRRLAEAQLVERTKENLGLAVCNRQAVHYDQLTGLRLGRKRHLQAERTDLLVQRGVEVTDARTMSLTTTDERRSATIAVTCGTAALLATELLAGTGNVGTLTCTTGCAACLFELPGDNAMQNVCARLEAEYAVIQFDVAVTLGIEGLEP